MNHYFRRIMFSVWLILLLAALATVVGGRFLNSANEGSSRYHAETLAVITRDLQKTLDSGEPAESLADRFSLGFENFLDIYIIDSNSRDLIGRELPAPVVEVLDDPEPSGDGRVLVHPESVDGYRVVGLLASHPSLILKSRDRPLLFVLLFLVSAVVSYGLARFVVLPIRHLRQAGNRVAAGDLSVRVSHTVRGRKDDIALLARDFDAMTERIDHLLKSQQRLMRDVSHELRSPLARLQALQSLARQRFSGEDDTHILDRMDYESERLNELIEQILSFARLNASQEITRQTTDISDLLKTIIDDALVEIGDNDVGVEFQGPERLTLRVNAGLIHSALENVLRNAVRYTPQGKSALVTLTQSNEYATVDVEDQGPGVPDDALEKLFDPFFQVDESRSPQNGGSGVGLAIARRAIELHDGKISALNRSDGGLLVSMRLPVQPDFVGAS
ncbi:MAG: ATP-binding protein [Pseudomonadota bacterium]